MSLPKKDCYSPLINHLRSCRTEWIHDPRCSLPGDCPCPETCSNRVETIILEQDTQIILDAIHHVKTQEAIKAVRNAIKPAKVSRPRSHIFLTINPKPEISLQIFLEKLKGFLYANKSFSDHLGIVEQRGTLEKDLGKGFHAHIILKRKEGGKPPSEITRNLKRSWEKYTTVDRKEIFNIQYIDEEFLLDKYDYMFGEKKDKEKIPKQEADKTFRKQNNIPEFYGNKNII